MPTDPSAPLDTCGRCGREAIGVVGDEALCETCYHESGSCCGDYGVKDGEFTGGGNGAGGKADPL